MLAKTLDKVSFWSLFVVIVFLPLFFFPFTQIPFETAKGFLLILGLFIAGIFWAIARFSDGKMVLPKSYILISGFLWTVAIFISAFYSEPRIVSFFGTILDFGSAFFFLASFLFMSICAIVVRSTKNARAILLGFILSSVVLFIFQTLHLFFPTALSLGVLNNSTENIMGSWNALGLFASLFSVLALFIVELLSIPKIVKWVLGLFVLLSIFVLAAVGFSLAWVLLEVFALFIFIYKISFEYHQNPTRKVKEYFPIASFVVFILAIVFFVFSQSLGVFIAKRLNLSNLDSRPSFSANLVVAKSVLAEHPVLGVGPNKFAEVWAKHKPEGVSKGPFWNNYFDFGAGVLPTIATTTGYMGIVALSVFFLIFILSGIRALLRSVVLGTGLDVVCFFIISLFLFSASFFYTTGIVIFVLAMGFAGIFVGVYSSSAKNDVVLVFSDNPQKSFFFLFLLSGMVVGFCFLGFRYLERFSSVSPLRAAVLNAQDSHIAIPAIERALASNPNDLYYRTAAQIYLLNFNSLVSSVAPLTDDQKATMQTSLDKAIHSATQATNINKNNYLNFQMLGLVYLSAGQFGVEGSFDMSAGAYIKALELNPLSPGIKLALARVYFFDGKNQLAEDTISESILLKPDYVDALIVMSQIKKSQGDNTSARTYAEKALLYTENNLANFPGDKTLISVQKDLVDYLGTLKTADPAEKESKNKTN